MEWLSSLRAAIDYMEEHLLTDIGADEVANAVHISSFYFQKGFKMVTGYSIGEYIRNRRLYLAALDLIKGEEKVIDLSYKYGYDTPESFTKAFSRFHGLSPRLLREQPSRITVFLPLVIEVSIKGGNKMEFAVEKMEPMKMIGFERVFSFESGYLEIPRFWDEFCEKYMSSASENGKSREEMRRVIEENGIGEFGICFDGGQAKGKFSYLIAGAYKGGDVPEGMKVVEIPAYEWAKFQCAGPMPNSLQTLNTRIFKEWLPGNGDYEIAAELNIEWYSEGDINSPDYRAGIWLPVKKKDF